MKSLKEFFSFYSYQDCYISIGCSTCGETEDVMSQDAYDKLLTDIDNFIKETYGDALTD